jgi:Subtilisin inhibitor-like
MRIGILIAVIAAVVGCGSSAAGTAAPPSTDLRISYFPQGRDEAGKKAWTLHCDPTAGTLPRRAAACQKLDAMTNPFARPRRNVTCTDVYGGPGQAVITGTYESRPVWVLLSQRNGCEISRWKKLAFLVGGIAPGGSSSSSSSS